ncbi:MAG: circadian clock protein KaiA [Thermosynechococcaceae cyanobacterium]
MTFIDSDVNLTAQASLSIYTCVGSPVLAEQVGQLLEGDRYQVVHQSDPDAFIQAVNAHNHQIDCLILEQTAQLSAILVRLHRKALLLPAIVLMPVAAEREVTEKKEPVSPSNSSYHTAEVWLPPSQLSQIPQQIGRAISQFLSLTPACRLPRPQGLVSDDWQISLDTQQRRLSDKLQERLGYLGVYYKRSSQAFLRNLPEPEQRKFAEELEADYRAIILEYFQQESRVNQKIDAFVTKVFLADVSVSYILELHMELMDAFAKKLKLEGRSEDILLDYRLTLIDTVAHLGEMYRRSVPRDS